MAKLSNRLRVLARRLGRPTIVGTFGKGTEGSLSVNSGLSGGRNCPLSCIHHPESTAPEALQTRACYSANSEYQRFSMRAKLARHEGIHPASLFSGARLELETLAETAPIPWLRFCVSGSMPLAKRMRKSASAVNALRALLSSAIRAGAKIHLPIASASECRYYRSIVGDLCTVRESAQNKRRWLTSPTPISFVSVGKTLRERLANGLELCKARRAKTGRKCAVCPAIKATFRRKLKESTRSVHCGDCDLCARSDVDIIYPLHV